MIITEPYKVMDDGVELVRTYSDKGRYITRDGLKFSEAIDVSPLKYKYDESSEEIPREEATVADFAQILREVGIVDEKALSL